MKQALFKLKVFKWVMSFLITGYFPIFAIMGLAPQWTFLASYLVPLGGLCCGIIAAVSVWTLTYHRRKLNVLHGKSNQQPPPIDLETATQLDIGVLNHMGENSPT